MSLSVLRSCASCAGQTDLNMRCTRCHTLYCLRKYQKAHWGSGGHKKVCAVTARARRDTNLEVQSRALVRVAHTVAHTSGGAPDNACCLVCLGGAGTTVPLVRGCACRGSPGWTHVTCLV